MVLNWTWANVCLLSLIVGVPSAHRKSSWHNSPSKPTLSSNQYLTLHVTWFWAGKEFPPHIRPKFSHLRVAIKSWKLTECGKTLTFRQFLTFDGNPNKVDFLQSLERRKVRNKSHSEQHTTLKTLRDPHRHIGGSWENIAPMFMINEGGISMFNYW